MVEDPGARNTSFDELRAAYEEAARALVTGGVDLVIVETVFDTLNAKAAIFALESAFEALGRRVPVIVSGTVTDASRPHPLGADRRGVLELHPARRAARGRAQLRPRVRSRSGRGSRSSRGSPPSR